MADALLIIDLQNGVCCSDEPVANLTSVVAGVNQRIQLYRREQKPIIVVQHTEELLPHGSVAWQVLPELQVTDQDIHVEKTHANSFYHTTLQDQLNRLGVQSLEICGAQVEFCVDTTVKMAHGLGYQLEMVRGLTTTTDNPSMTAQQTIDFYQDRIWNHRFLEFVD